jgi:two-component system, chemotaxis family, sensor kinase CheA
MESEAAEPIRTLLGEIRDIARTFAGSGVGLDSLARELILDKVASLPAPVPAPKSPRETLPIDASVPRTAAEHPEERKSEERERTMRIPEASMDRFLDQVGELMGLEEQFRYLGKRMLSGTDGVDLAADLRQAVEQFGHLSSRLSGSVLELRRTEARPLLQKVPRLCRDVAGATGKTVGSVVRGEDVRIDKSYLELLDAPLMHMVRNACDHGIEGAQERVRKGKSPAGRVEVSILEMEESVVLRIEDDGRGLDLEGLRKKAVELGMLKPEAPFGEAEAVQVLFRSGVSTASAVTDISGRGVGMDVVKREIEGAGGRIEVKNRPGLGCAFLVTLPRGITTRITDGFLFRCGSERFVVPMRVVVETFPTSAAKITRLPEGGTTVLFRQEILRMVESAEILESPLSAAAEGVYVRLHARDEECVLRVEEVLGVQRTVIKPVDEICRAKGLFAGAALVGDGGLAMVVGEDGLADWLRRGGRRR